MKTINRILPKIAMMAFVGVMMLTSVNVGALFAQDKAPDGYCIPREWAVEQGISDQGAYPRYRCYPEWYPENYYYYLRYRNATINSVKIYPVGNEKEYVLYNVTGEEFLACYQFFDIPDYLGEGEMSTGEQYEIKVSVKAWQYAYDWGYVDDYCGYSYYPSPVMVRVFMDWGVNGDWKEHIDELTNNNEWINQYQQYKYRLDPSENCSLFDAVALFTVPEDMPLAKFRMRVTASMGYGYQSGSYGYEYYYPSNANDEKNACITGYYYMPYPGYAYGSYSEYGETEDYIVGIGVAVKGSFPNNEEPDNILLAGEKYNGETRAPLDDPDGDKKEFKNPMFELGAPMKEGTTIKYQIYGPLPLGADESKKLVYEALDPNSATPEPEIDMSGSVWKDQLEINITKARGKYSVAGTGTFKATSGGEYELRMTVALPGKAPKIVSREFTVAWADDIMAHSIVAPVTDGFPRYFKYTRGLSIDVTGRYVNTGLNPVNKFKATAKITDPDGNLYKELVYDYDSEQNIGDTTIFMAEGIDLNFGTIKPDKIGQYKMSIEVDLLSAKDMEDYNDRFMRANEDANK